VQVPRKHLRGDIVAAGFFEDNTTGAVDVALADYLG
jgi:hypothetical protein